MYTILLNDTNELITSVKERIMQRSKLVDSLHFLVDPIYKGLDMSGFTAMMEYILPVSREYHSEILVKSDALYKEKLEYKVPFDTNLTKEAGNVEVQLTFVKVSLDADGENIQQVRKTSPTIIKILPISAWSDIVADNALGAIDQRLIQAEAMIQAVGEMAQYIDENKADNITLDKETNSIYLTANGKQIGDEIVINGLVDGIISIRIDDDGNLIVTYANGTEKNIGRTSVNCPGVYIPSMDQDIMTFTLSDKATENVISFDIDKDNNWTPIGDGGQSNYIWQQL